MSDVGAATWRGLTTAEVAERTAGGKVNRTDDRSSRTVAEIVRANVFTRFNAVIAALMAIVLALGEWRDALFGFVMVLNLVIGVVQEWRAKTTLDRLSLITAPKVAVWRDGTRQEVASEEVVIDDVFELAPGDQVVVDGRCCTPMGCRSMSRCSPASPTSVDKAEGERGQVGQLRDRRRRDGRGPRRSAPTPTPPG